MTHFLPSSQQSGYESLVGGGNMFGGNLMLLILPSYCMPMSIPRRLSMCSIKTHSSLSSLIIGPERKYFVCLLSVCVELQPRCYYAYSTQNSALLFQYLHRLLICSFLTEIFPFSIYNLC